MSRFKRRSHSTNLQDSARVRRDAFPEFPAGEIMLSSRVSFMIRNDDNNARILVKFLGTNFWDVSFPSLGGLNPVQYYRARKAEINTAILSGMNPPEMRIPEWLGISQDDPRRIRLEPVPNPDSSQTAYNSNTFLRWEIQFAIISDLGYPGRGVEDMQLGKTLLTVWLENPRRRFMFHEGGWTREGRTMGEYWAIRQKQLEATGVSPEERLGIILSEIKKNQEIIGLVRKTEKRPVSRRTGGNGPESGQTRIF